MGLKSWNFWTPITGTLYGWTAYHPDDVLLVLQGATITPRRVYAYGGKTMQVPWTKRISDHAWGSARYGTVAKPWMDTVPGWSPNGTVQDIVDAGGVRIIWQARTVPLVLSIGEYLIAIRCRRPYYNYQGNLGNSCRVPIYRQEDQREQRDLLRNPGSGVPVRVRSGAVSHQSRSVVHTSGVGLRVGNAGRWFGYYRRFMVAALLLVLVALFWPGMPGADGVSLVLGWVGAHRDQLIAGGLVGVGLLIAVGRKPRRGQRGRRNKC